MVLPQHLICVSLYLEIGLGLSLRQHLLAASHWAGLILLRRLCSERALLEHGNLLRQIG